MSGRSDSLELSAGELLVVVESGAVLAVHVEVAGSWLARAAGWLGRRRFPPGRALWLPRVRMVHTLGMRGLIDVAFVAADGRVLGLRRRLAPWRVARGPAGTAATVEFPPGVLGRAGLRTGDRLAARRRPAGARP